jgi:hypothetical protein
MRNKAPHPKGRIVNDAIAIFGLDWCIVNPETNELIPQGVAELRHHIEVGDFVIFTTQRAFSRADETSKWIQEQFDIQPFHDFTMLMRRDDDARSRTEIKREFAHFIGDHAAKEQFEITGMFDADKDVVATYQSMGFVMAKVLNGRNDTPEAVQDVIEEIPLPPPPIMPTTAAAALAALFPEGIALRTAEDHQRYQMFGVFLSSTIRFAMSGFADKMALREMAEMVRIFE